METAKITSTHTMEITVEYVQMNKVQRFTKLIIGYFFLFKDLARYHSRHFIGPCRFLPH